MLKCYEWPEGVIDRWTGGASATRQETFQLAELPDGDIELQVIGHDGIWRPVTCGHPAARRVADLLIKDYQARNIMALRKRA